MRQIELVPDLSSCIETVARREHEQAAKELLASEAPGEEIARQSGLAFLRMQL